MKKALFSIFFISAVLFACSQNDDLTLDNDTDDSPLQHVTSSNQGENPGKDNGDKTDADNDSDDKNDSENNDDKVDTDNDSDDENDVEKKCVWLPITHSFYSDFGHGEGTINWIYYNNEMDYKYQLESQSESESNSGKSVSTNTFTIISSENHFSSVSVVKTYTYDLYGNEICQIESETITTYFEETLPTHIPKSSYSKSISHYNDGREFESNTATDYTLEYLGKKNDYNVYKVTRNDDGLYYEYKIKDDMIIEMDTYMNSILSTHTE